MDDVIFSRILLGIDSYDDFKNLKMACKKTYKVSKLVWEEWKTNWIVTQFPKLFPKLVSFVLAKDIVHFFNILVKILNPHILKKECSVLVIKGPSPSGKSLFINCLDRLFLCEKFGGDLTNYSPAVIEFDKPVVSHSYYNISYLDKKNQ